ncbi:hypothetical protein COCC4DRAFT_132922 [Bipolaris maydis ATCC 48331]|uniref:Uncharacterized protein n=2 Tax=Cochliobolus heterostrophus TaxID=5016 RepID=M2UHV6_COCH5|nr:uncharacterized protein COCC4DRAFT_132922 [Bipolaris maydis ATCC 48331]EMD93256.1 hypothetical protein COCHEDRAFT_1095987 [Bipolaris maydis C5]ENI07296.1 hypothetical protein COCC4DRAFT_132922 [Bipolaris maydis ATCC 48331]KAJ5027594.1 hypothetical protein J3E73DRAFT_186534 [Bipolaris maydis]
MREILPYQGPFSFVSSRLETDIKSVLPHYDKKNPRTWPYVTLATIEERRPYYGYPDLPAGVAYQRSVLLRYHALYSAEDRKQSASLNGSFHERYPCNYDQYDQLKDWVGMSKAEYQRYMENAAEDINDITEDAYYDGLRLPLRQPCCANSRCIETRREAAKLRKELSHKESQLMNSQQSLKEFEAIEERRHNVSSHVQAELERQRQRAGAAEREYEICRANNINLLWRVRELERQAAQKDELEAYCSQLEEEVDVLKGKQRRDVVESDPDEDLMEGYISSAKKTRSSSVDWS